MGHLTLDSFQTMRYWQEIMAFLFLLISPSVGAQTQQKPSDTNDSYSYSISETEFRNIFFADADKAWLVIEDHHSDEVHLLQTVDGGKKWSDTSAPKGFVRVYFRSPQIGWGLQSIVSKNKDSTTYHIFRTNSGGSDWKRVADRPLLRTLGDTRSYLTDFAFMDSEHGWFVGGQPNNAGLILETSDGGKTARRPKGLPSSIKSCWGVFVLGRAVWIYGLGFFLHSEDMGRTWSSLDTSDLKTNRELFWISSGLLLEDGHGWLTGSTSKAVVLATKDRGHHWASQFETDDPDHIDRISGWDRDHACAVAHPNWLFCTTDGGLTWTKTPALPLPRDDQANFFEQLVILKSGRGWALRGGGYLYQTENGGQSWNEIDSIKRLLSPE